MPQPLERVAAEQPDPKLDRPKQGEDVCALVTADLEARVAHGAAKYGERLKVNNGRDAMLDGYQEALDHVLYFRQEIEKRRQFANRATRLREILQRKYEQGDIALELIDEIERFLRGEL